MRLGIEKLISISSPAIGDSLEEYTCSSDWCGLMRSLFDMLRARNGFYAFESALLVRPIGKVESPRAIELWNTRSVWLDTYELELPQLHFFAEDVFGGQFAVSDDSIVSFDPETGETEKISDTFEGWAHEIMSDYDYFTGYSLASDWQKENGALPIGHRLIPRQLFVLGGGI